MTGVIEYQTIRELLSTFNNLKVECEETTKSVSDYINNYRSAVSIDGSYDSEIFSLASKMSTLSTNLVDDYDRICRFLEKTAAAAEAAHTKAISTIQATQIWNATETVTKG